MDESFDFNAFISSPQADEYANGIIPVNGISTDTAVHNAGVNSAMFTEHASLPISFSGQDLDSTVGVNSLATERAIDLMAPSVFMDQLKNIMDGPSNTHAAEFNSLWNTDNAATVLPQLPVDSALTHPTASNFFFDRIGTTSGSHETASIGQHIPGPVSDPNMQPAVALVGTTISEGSFNGLATHDPTASYRSQIAAHHIHLLDSNVARYSASDIRVPGSQAFPPIPTIRPVSQTRPRAGAKAVGKSYLSLQERRRLARLAAKQSRNGSVPAQQTIPVQQQHQQQQIHPQSLATVDVTNVQVLGRGTKRGMNSDTGVINTPPFASTQTAGRSMFFTADGSDSFSSSSSVSPRKKLERKPSNYIHSSASDIPASPVFKGQYNTVSGDEVPTANKYSSSGVDVLGILSRAHTRPNQRISLGPVDLSCAFTISDAHHPEQPLIYASDTFCRLTGYTPSEILGRNCRFLQVPSLPLAAGNKRQHTDNRAVEHLKRHLVEQRECQASLINYRKDGTPFINLVTVVPVSWADPSQVDFLVGFQVDLVEQPASVVERKEDGSYVVNYRSSGEQPSSGSPVSNKTGNAIAAKKNKQAAIAAEIVDLMNGNGPGDAKQWSRVLLENSHDLIYVLSLKGTLLYVSPSVERILGYTADEVIGKSISEFCHPSDVVPVFRELKDSTSNASIAAAASRNMRKEGVANPLTKGGGGQAGPRVNLSMRMRHKEDGHRWIESTGKLHLEQGKGRKVVISSGRPRPVYNLAWEHVRRGAENPEPSFWAKLSIDGIFLSTTGPISEVLGCDQKDVFGRHVLEVSNYEAAPSLLQALRSSQAMSVSHLMGEGGRTTTPVFSSFYPSSAAAGPALPTVFVHVQRASAEYSWMVPNVAYPKGGPQPTVDITGTNISSLSSVFAELATERSSSWVFEMHQLQNVNRRLKDEIRALRRQSKDYASKAVVPAPVGVALTSPGASTGLVLNGVLTPAVLDTGPIKRRPDHGHGHRQHLRPTANLGYLHETGSSGSSGNNSSASDITTFGLRPIKRQWGSGDETVATTTTTSGDTSEKDGSVIGSGSGSDSRRGSGSAEVLI